MRFFRSTLVALAAFSTVVSCGDIHHSPSVRVRPSIEVLPSTMSSTERARLVREVAAMRARNELRLEAVREEFLQATILWNQTVAANEAAKKDAETANTEVSADRGDGYRPPAAVSAPPPAPVAAPSNFGSLSGVVQCIKNHESGDYGEASHPWEGSGAYQFIPGTWRAWSERAGYGGYAFAYQAPPAVQDAVLQYTLTNGGAGNWSNRFGSDPCTAGLPGGG